jgi:AcrR family transcriptional regulator
MPDSDPDPRALMVAGAADMIRRRGLSATSVRELAKHTGAPLGSTYHYFPGGKQQLAAEAVGFAGDAVTRQLRRRMAAGPVAGLHAFIAAWRETLLTTDFRVGCPVLAVAIEEPEEDSAALRAAAAAFSQWCELLATALCDDGAAPAEAGRLATLIVAAIEGAVVMCRAQRSVQPLDNVGPVLEALVADAIS